MIVVDASVAAKWVLPEVGSHAALDLQTGPRQLFAPDLIRLEVTAALTRRGRAEKDGLSAEDVFERCARWLKLLGQAVVSLIPEQDLLEHAVRLSVELKHPLQDCLYLAAALRLDAPLITADTKFHGRASGAFPTVSMLGGCHSN